MIDHEKLQQAVRLFLEAIGEDPGREGLKGTPQRVARMCDEVLMGMNVDPKKIIKVLESEDHDEIVLVKDIPFHSICEHHLLPFVGVAHVAYIPEGSRVTGLSKLARVVEVHSRRLQLQERLTTAVAETIMEALRPKGVLTIMEAEHLCMTMRGARTPGRSRHLPREPRDARRSHGADQGPRLMPVFLPSIRVQYVS
jgi:GTP cyclohydrolase I